MPSRPPSPPRLPLEIHDPLSARDKALHDKARYAHHSALMTVRTARTQAIHHQMDRRMLTNTHQSAGARRGIVLDGPATVGKSIPVKMFAYDFKYRLRQAQPERFEPTYRIDATPSTTPEILRAARQG